MNIIAHEAFGFTSGEVRGSLLLCTLTLFPALDYSAHHGCPRCRYSLRSRCLCWLRMWTWIKPSPCSPKGLGSSWGDIFHKQGYKRKGQCHARDHECGIFEGAPALCGTAQWESLIGYSSHTTLSLLPEWAHQAEAALPTSAPVLLTAKCSPSPYLQNLASFLPKWAFL